MGTMALPGSPNNEVPVGDPFVLEAKASAQMLARKLLKKPFEPEFRLLSRVEPGGRSFC